MKFPNLSGSEWLSIGALVISFLALVAPIIRARQNAKIKEVISVPTFNYATWIYVVVANYSTAPLTIYGAQLGDIRLYRHRHYFADRPDEGKQYSTTFPFKMSPQSSAGLLLEFVTRDKKPLNKTDKICLSLDADHQPIKKEIVIAQSSVSVETALREI